MEGDCLQACGAGIGGRCVDVDGPAGTAQGGAARDLFLYAAGGAGCRAAASESAAADATRHSSASEIPTGVDSEAGAGASGHAPAGIGAGCSAGCAGEGTDDGFPAGRAETGASGGAASGADRVVFDGKLGNTNCAACAATG